MPRSQETHFRYFLFNNSTRAFTEICDGFVCGRLEGDLQLPTDDLISRRHCQFSIRGNDIYVLDLESTNRARVNTVPIVPNKKRRLHLNDVIEIGSQRFILTNQDKFAPSHVKDVNVRKTFFKGFIKDDGSITASIMYNISNRTRILLDRRSFQRLQLKSSIREKSRRIPSMLFTGFFIFAWIAFFTFTQPQAASEHAPLITLAEILAKGVPIALATILLSWALHSLFVTKLADTWKAELGLTLVAGLMVLGVSAFAVKQTGLWSQLAKNLVYTQCVAQASPEHCHAWMNDGRYRNDIRFPARAQPGVQ